MHRPSAVRRSALRRRSWGSAPVVRLPAGRGCLPERCRRSTARRQCGGERSARAGRPRRAAFAPGDEQRAAAAINHIGRQDHAAVAQAVRHVSAQRKEDQRARAGSGLPHDVAAAVQSQLRTRCRPSRCPAAGLGRARGASGRTAAGRLPQQRCSHVEGRGAARRCGSIFDRSSCFAKHCKQLGQAHPRHARLRLQRPGQRLQQLRPVCELPSHAGQGKGAHARCELLVS